MANQKVLITIHKVLISELFTYFVTTTLVNHVISNQLHWMLWWLQSS